MTMASSTSQSDFLLFLGRITSSKGPTIAELALKNSTGSQGNPINRYGYIGDGKKAMLTLRNDILLPMQLRRTKAERAEDVRLPDLKIIIQENTFNEVVFGIQSKDISRTTQMFKDTLLGKTEKNYVTKPFNVMQRLLNSFEVTRAERLECNKMCAKLENCTEIGRGVV